MPSTASLASRRRMRGARAGTARSHLRFDDKGAITRRAGFVSTSDQMIGFEGGTMAGIALGVLLVGGLFAMAEWERRGRPLPHVRELELPVHGRAAAVVAFALVVVSLTIIVLDLTLISVMSR